MSVNIDTLAVQMSLGEVNALLKQKEKNLKRIATLQAQKADLEGQIAEIDSEVAALSGTTAVDAAAPAAEAAPKKNGRRKKGKKRGRLAKKTGKRMGRPPKAAAEAAPEAPKRRGRPPKAASEKKAPAKKKTGKRTGPSYRQLAADALRFLNGEAQLKDVASFVAEKRTGDSKATASLYTTVSTAMRNAPEFVNVGRGRWKLVG